MNDKGPDAKIDPDAVRFYSLLLVPGLLFTMVLWGRANLLDLMAGQIADAYWHLHTQPRTSFTFEIDMRPFVEKW